jgi:hypothetical protein
MQKWACSEVTSPLVLSRPRTIASAVASANELLMTRPLHLSAIAHPIGPQVECNIHLLPLHKVGAHFSDFIIVGNKPAGLLACLDSS